jgi:hypothetical protein
MSEFRDSPEEKTLKEILAATWQLQASVINQNGLLEALVANSIANNQLLQRIVDNTNPKPATLTRSIKVRFTGDSPMPNSLVLNVGQTSTASIQPLLADGVTPSGGTLSNVAYNFTDPSATVALNPDGVTALVTGVAPSTGPVSGTATCTVTDTDGVVSPWSQPFTIQTNAVAPPPTQLTQSIQVNFTAPQ